MPQPLLVTFEAGVSGMWQIDSIAGVIGENLSPAKRLAIFEGSYYGPSMDSSWALRGTTGNTRYTYRAEIETLTTKQRALNGARATCAALIPIRKTEAWWELAQDERRAIFEEQSRHIRIGLEYLPAVARRLHHSRELGEPFDFLTWFEYAPEHSTAFEELVVRLRETEEWKYVDREVDVRLTRL